MLLIFIELELHNWDVEKHPLQVCDILKEELQYTRVGDIVDKKVVFALKPSASLATCMHVSSDTKLHMNSTSNPARAYFCASSFLVV